MKVRHGKTDGKIDLEIRLTYLRCLGMFLDETNCRDHGVSCYSQQCSMTFVNGAGSMAVRMLAYNGITVYRDEQMNPVLDGISFDEDTNESLFFVAQWETRPKRGFAHGSNYVQPFEEDITRWFFKTRKIKAKR